MVRQKVFEVGLQPPQKLKSVKFVFIQGQKEIHSDTDAAAASAAASTAAAAAAAASDATTTLVVVKTEAAAEAAAQAAAPAHLYPFLALLLCSFESWKHVFSVCHGQK